MDQYQDLLRELAEEAAEANFRSRTTQEIIERAKNFRPKKRLIVIASALLITASIVGIASSVQSLHQDNQRLVAAKMATDALLDTVESISIASPESTVNCSGLIYNLGEGAYCL